MSILHIVSIVWTFSLNARMKLLFLSKFTMCMTVYFLADDAGISNTATSYIAEAWQQNLLDGFSIVANRDCSKQLQNILQKNRHRECILSAHLNLTDGKSIAMHGSGAIIADDQGRLRISFIKALYLVIIGGKRKQRFLQEVQTEWNAQINFIKNICGDRKLSFVNGHNHLHMIPSLFQIATELSKKHNIPCVRIAKEHFSIQSFDIFFQPFFYFNSFKIALAIFGSIITVSCSKSSFMRHFCKVVTPIMASSLRLGTTINSSDILISSM
mgnify:CR=1 FL=1